MKGEVQSGEMRKRIIIQTIDDTPTSSGETTDMPNKFAEVWASVEPLNGREEWLAKEQQDLTTHKIRIRYLVGVNPRMRAIYNNRVFNFTAIKNIGELNHTIEIMATEVL